MQKSWVIPIHYIKDFSKIAQRLSEFISDWVNYVKGKKMCMLAGITKGSSPHGETIHNQLHLLCLIADYSI